MQIRNIAIFAAILLSSGIVRGASRCATFPELTAQGIPLPMELISEISDTKYGHVSQFFVTKLWYRMTPQQKKTFTLYEACRTNMVRQDWGVVFYDAATGKKLTAYINGKFASYEK